MSVLARTGGEGFFPCNAFVFGSDATVFSARSRSAFWVDQVLELWLQGLVLPMLLPFFFLSCSFGAQKSFLRCPKKVYKISSILSRKNKVSVM